MSDAAPDRACAFRTRASSTRFVSRLEPRLLGARILRDLDLEVVVNRGVVYEPDQLRWAEETHGGFGIQNIVLVGGESSKLSYPGPSVVEAAEQIRSARPEICLGGITIPSRPHEADRIRRKNAAGLVFFTTQILFDSNDIVWLALETNAKGIVTISACSASIAAGLLALAGRLCFPETAFGPAPSSSLTRIASIPGVIPSSTPTKSASEPAPAASSLDRSLDLAQRILMDVFDNLPPDPPQLGLNIEHINQRNFRPALRMLEHLGSLYTNLVAARARPAGFQNNLVTSS